MFYQQLNSKNIEKKIFNFNFIFFKNKKRCLVLFINPKEVIIYRYFLLNDF